MDGGVILRILRHNPNSESVVSESAIWDAVKLLEDVQN
jgi:hypothetical protein